MIDIYRAIEDHQAVIATLTPLVSDIEAALVENA